MFIHVPYMFIYGPYIFMYGPHMIRYGLYMIIHGLYKDIYTSRQKVPPMNKSYIFYMFLLQETDALVMHTSRQKGPPMNKLVYVLYVLIAIDGRARDAHKSTESSADEQIGLCFICLYCKIRTRS